MESPSAALDSACRALDGEPASACVLDTSGSIVHCNGAWDRFALENGGAPRALGKAVLGRHWISSISGTPVREYFEETLRRALGGEALSVRGECNSALIGRRVVSRFQPFRSEPDGAVAGVAIVCTVVRTAPLVEFHDERPPRDEIYLDDHGHFHMCACCRRVRRAGPSCGPPSWDFVPEYVAHRRLDTSHTFCETCLALQYGP